jgi:hypothetical protein
MGNFYLLMRDGGKVKFVRTDNNPNAETLHFIATQITDPYGLTTLLKRDSAGRLWQIVEPGGRYLQLNYTNNVLTTVQAFSAPNQPATETVSYAYEGINYKYVYYDDGSHATYTYGPSNSGAAGRLIRTCDDIRFAGPMRQIKYDMRLPLRMRTMARSKGRKTSMTRWSRR